MDADASRRRNIGIATAACAVLFLFAFMAAPHSCEWGLNAYFWSVVACIVALFALPFVRSAPDAPRIGLAFAFAAAACLTWIAGLFIANVRIMCRLF